MNTIYSSGLQGINNSILRMTASASNVSQAFVTDEKAVRVEENKIVQTEDTVDLSKEAVEMTLSEVQLKASTAVIKTLDETQQSLIDILA